MLGCSDMDPLDELSDTYQATAIPQWNDEDTQGVDVVFNICDLGPPVTVEPLLPFNVKIEVTPQPEALDFSIYGYQVNFRNNHGNYFEVGTGQMEDLSPAELPTLDDELNQMVYSLSTPVISAGDTYTYEGMLVWSHGDILYYLDTFLANQTFLNQLILAGQFAGRLEQETADFVYDMQVTLLCRFAATDETFEIVTPWTPVHFVDLYNCEDAI